MYGIVSNLSKCKNRRKIKYLPYQIYKKNVKNIQS